MSNFTNDVALTVNEKLVWRTAADGDQVYTYIIQKSPSGRARCRKCSQYIEKEALRCGMPIKHSNGENGWITAWQHLGCTRVSGPEECNSCLYGISKLTEEEREKAIALITSDETPEHLKPLNPDDLVRRGRIDEATPPKTLLRPLLPYQKEGLGWLLRQESSEMKGGILADEMGMGKTIQMISLLLAHRLPGPTLVVCPVSSMLQWEAEIKEHVVPGTLSVVVVYRTSKVNAEDLEKADVVLTTYPMIEQAWRALVNRIKVPCPYCGELFIPRQLVVHNLYFCGPNAKKTMKQSKREKNAPEVPENRRKVQSQATIQKGLRTLHVEVDEEDTKETPAKAATATSEGGHPPSLKRGVVGPMGMYEELMQEAGRRVRSRWDPARRGSRSSSDGSDDDGPSGSDSSSSAESPTQYDSDAKEKEEKAAVVQEERDKATLKCFCCTACGFQILRYPFCPRTGQHHVLTEEMRQRIETDTGGDQVDLDRSVFHRISWSRIVLDEAHRIKGRTTSTARSAFALSAEYRWCLTGTPLQNRVGDLYSLLRFLRLKPYSRYFCATEGCSCSSLSHPFSGTSLHQCIFCGHGPIQHYAYFNRYVLNPITRYGYIGDGRKGMILLVNDVFSKMMLRRTKAERAADLHLPSLSIKVQRVQLTKEERNFYESLYKKSTSDFDTFVRKGTILHNYAHIFQLLSRLRQALDHPLLVVKGMKVGAVTNAKGVCGVCGERIEGESSLKVNPCRHLFHRLCLGQFLESAPDMTFHCPTCFVRINVDLRQLRGNWDEEEDAGGAILPPELEEEEETQSRCGDDGGTTAAQVSGETEAGGLQKQGRHARSQKAEHGVLSRLDTTKPLHGTKLDAIATYIQGIPPEEKVIVFSQFGDMLDLTQYWLQKRFVKSVKLVGTLSLSQRQSVLQAFIHDPAVQVILISLKAGGEGLNLQVANHVVLIDPWWNPAVELQAIQRAHRIGQQRPVVAMRFVTENSVEERMVELQDKKMLVFEGTIDGRLQSLHKLSEEDLQFLFTR